MSTHSSNMPHLHVQVDARADQAVMDNIVGMVVDHAAIETVAYSNVPVQMPVSTISAVPLRQQSPTRDQRATSPADRPLGGDHFQPPVNGVLSADRVVGPHKIDGTPTVQSAPDAALGTGDNRGAGRGLRERDSVAMYANTSLGDDVGGESPKGSFVRDTDEEEEDSSAARGEGSGDGSEGDEEEGSGEKEKWYEDK